MLIAATIEIDPDWHEVLITTNGATDVFFYDRRRGELRGGVQMWWPGGVPRTGSRHGTLSSGRCYLLDDNDGRPVNFLADPRDVAELERLGALRRLLVVRGAAG